MAFLRARRLIRALAFLAAQALVLLPAVAAPAAGVGEYSVKAAYLYKFAPFVEWPQARLPAGAPLQICVAGADPFGPLLDQVTAGQSVADHRVQVTRLARVDAQATCDILYVRASKTQSAEAALAAVKGKPVLTVTDEAEGGGPHGMLHFVLVNNRVRFQVDPAQAQASGLAISSKLLSLGLPREGGGR